MTPQPSQGNRPPSSKVREVPATGRSRIDITALAATCVLGYASIGDAQAEPPSEPVGRELLGALSEGDVVLDADAVARRAVQTAPSVASARAASEQAREGAARALVPLYPRLDLTARYTRLSDTETGGVLEEDQVTTNFTTLLTMQEPDPGPFDSAVAGTLDQFVVGLGDAFPTLVNQYALRAEVTYPVSDVFATIWPAYRAAEGLAEVQALRAEAERRSVELAAREALYAYARARAAVLVAQASLQQVEAQRQDVVAMVQAGSVAPVEELRADARVSAARVSVARAQAGLGRAKTGLERLLHRRIEGTIGIREALDAPLAERSGDAEALLGRAFERRAEMRALRELVRSRQQQLRSESGAQWPSLSLSAGFDVQNPEPRVFPQRDRFGTAWDVSAVLSWSPHDTLSASHRYDEAALSLRQARADVVALQDAIRVEVHGALEDERAAQAALAAARTGIRAAEESYRVRRVQFRAGAARASDLVDAETELRRARLQLLDAAIDAYLARARLARATGQPLGP